MLGLPVVDSAVLLPCAAPTDPARWNQLWSWTGAHRWYGQQQDIAAGTSGYCMTPAVITLGGATLMVSTVCTGTFAPEARVGAGAAGFSTHQIVNYREFGRCVDVTDANISSTFMISYPCKQDPTATGANLLWNHKWYYQEPAAGQDTVTDQEIYVHLNDSPTQKFCLQTPDSASSSTYPIFAACNGSARQSWTRTSKTASHVSSYLLIDTYGRCLTADGSDLYNSNWSRLRMLPCDGSERQKWNAPAVFTDANFGGFKESNG